MILTGQYDSPFVRRVAVTLHHYRLPFERRILSVFADFDEMLTISPLGKVPVLDLDDGERLFDSRMILDHLDALVPGSERLVPTDAGPERRAVLRSEAVALGLCEKLYERGVEYARKAEGKADPAWADRAKRQIRSALAWLEALRPDPWLVGDHMTRADVTAAIAVTYLAEKQPEILADAPCPRLAAHSGRCEALPPFAAAAYSASEAARTGWAPHPDQAN